MSENRVITSISDLTRCVAEARNKLRGDLWWRGHAVESWKLVPGVFRADQGYEYEHTVTQLFLQRAESRYQDCPARNNPSAWLFLMQHYGLPTRLLDWSESPLVALYFAVAKKRPGDAAIYALNPMLLNERQLNRRGILPPDDSMIDQIIVPAFKDLPETAEPAAQAAALIVNETDSRMLAQLTAFSVHSGAEPLDSLDGHGEFLMRFEIPAGRRAALRDQLWHHGIRRSTLFPDLANLAAELRGMSFRKPGSAARAVPETD